MAKEPPYDPNLTQDLDAFTGSLGAPTLAPEAAAPLAVGPDELALLQQVIPEVAAWSRQLDQSAEPSAGFAVAQAAAMRSQSLGERVREFLTGAPAGPSIGPGLSRLLELLARLLKNAVNRLAAFARALGINSFDITVGSTPPNVALTLHFG